MKTNIILQSFNYYLNPSSTSFLWSDIEGYLFLQKNQCIITNMHIIILHHWNINAKTKLITNKKTHMKLQKWVSHY